MCIPDLTFLKSDCGAVKSYVLRGRWVSARVFKQCKLNKCLLEIK